MDGAADAARTLSTNLLLAHKKSKVVYEPLGVVAAIVSWNYPFREPHSCLPLRLDPPPKSVPEQTT